MVKKTSLDTEDTKYLSMLPHLFAKVDKLYDELVGTNGKGGHFEDSRKYRDEFAEMVRDFSDFKRYYKQELLETQKIRKDGFDRLKILEEESVVRWVKNNKRLSVILFLTGATYVMPDGLRVIVMDFLSQNWIKFLPW